jgi:hypothetical protein
MKRAILAVCLAAMGVGFGCSNNRADEPLANTRPQISLVSSNREIAVGDTTTLTVNSRNTLGRDARVEWTTTGGDLQTADSDRVARLMFEQPGMYTVTASLLVDGREVDRESVNINVRPLR